MKTLAELRAAFAAANKHEPPREKINWKSPRGKRRLSKILIERRNAAIVERVREQQHNNNKN